MDDFLEAVARAAHDWPSDDIVGYVTDYGRLRFEVLSDGSVCIKDQNDVLRLINDARKARKVSLSEALDAKLAELVKASM